MSENQGSSCYDATVLITTPPCRPLTNHIFVNLYILLLHTCKYRGMCVWLTSSLPLNHWYVSPGRSEALQVSTTLTPTVACWDCGCNVIWICFATSTTSTCNMAFHICTGERRSSSEYCKLLCQFWFANNEYIVYCHLLTRVKMLWWCCIMVYVLDLNATLDDPRVNADLGARSSLFYMNILFSFYISSNIKFFCLNSEKDTQINILSSLCARTNKTFLISLILKRSYKVNCCLIAHFLWPVAVRCSMASWWSIFFKQRNRKAREQERSASSARRACAGLPEAVSAWIEHLVSSHSLPGNTDCCWRGFSRRGQRWRQNFFIFCLGSLCYCSTFTFLSSLL